MGQLNARSKAGIATCFLQCEHSSMSSNELGDRIAAARERAGMNKNQLARQLGTSWQHVDHWEKGRTQPSLPSIRRIAEVLHVTVDALIGEGGPHTALAAFLSQLAPSDLTAEEEAWLRRAPVDHEGASPEDYRGLLDELRRISSKPKSGRRLKVDPDALERAIRKRANGPA
jgi:transcriptional regulator with XRE-family HTH domain